MNVLKKNVKQVRIFTIILLFAGFCTSTMLAKNNPGFMANDNQDAVHSRIKQSKNSSVWNVRDLGAQNNKEVLSTRAIQNAIDSCAALGGGQVLFPAGEYLSGSLVLKSNVNIHLQAGAVIYGSPNADDYTEHEPQFHSSTNVYQTCALFFGENIENVSFTGFGKVIFNGDSEDFHMTHAEWRARENELKRPFGFLFRRCNRILLQDLELYGSGFWMQQYIECQDLKLNRVKIVNHANWNNDGLDINNCKDVTISDCVIYCSDDAICIKSTTAGLNENILINNCILRTHYNGFKIGTETMGGGVRNLVMTNCAISSPGYKNKHGGFPGTDNDIGFAGIAIQSCDGAIIENVHISNIVIDSMRTPIFIRLEKRMRPMYPGAPVQEVGKMRNISLSNILATNATKLSSSITGVPGHYVEGVTLSNIKIVTKGGGTQEDVEKEVPEKETAYPDVIMFETNLPSYGFYLRHVKGLNMDNIRIVTEEKDERYAICLSDVHDSEISNLKTQTPQQSQSLLLIEKSSNILVENTGTMQELKHLIDLKETPANAVFLQNNFHPFLNGDALQLIK